MPEGIFQVVHGDKEMVDLILDHPAISAVSRPKSCWAEPMRSIAR